MTPPCAMLRSPSRRRCLLGLGLLPLFATTVHAHGTLGPVAPPRPLPADLSVVYRDRRVRLRALMLGKNTAVQLMFAGCSSICPVQGAMFAAVQSELGPAAGPTLQLLSLSVDALGDDAVALKSWLQRFAARPGWRAAALEPGDLAAFQALLDTSASAPAGHSTAVYFFDTGASLVWRTNDLPGAREVAATLRRMHQPAAS